MYSNRYVFTNFTAWLKEEEVKALRATNGCVQLYLKVFLPLATTHVSSDNGEPLRLLALAM
jgi:hypothetical protein